MRIGIDARFIGPQGTGLGKYTEKLIKNLQVIDTKNEYVIFLKKDNWDYLNFKNSRNFTKALADIPWYSTAEQIRLPSILNKAKLDLLHIPHFNAPMFYKGKFVVTIHDLIHHEFTETSATTRNPIIFKGKRIAYRLVIKSAIYKARRIIVPSEFVKSQILKYYRVESWKIIVTYEAAEEEYEGVTRDKIQVTRILKKYNIKTPFIIYVGNAYPHKNLNNLLEAFKLIKTSQKQIKLVIVCARDTFAKRLENEISKLSLEKDVTLTGYISSKELSAIFKSASAYIFPTLSEGFGIPGLNAMASKIPVICSSIPTLREIYGDAAVFFDPKDHRDIARETMKVLASDTLSKSLISKGETQVQKYSWKKMANLTLNVYKEASI